MAHSVARDLELGYRWSWSHFGDAAESVTFSRFISLPAPLSPSPSCPRRSYNHSTPKARLLSNTRHVNLQTCLPDPVAAPNSLGDIHEKGVFFSSEDFPPTLYRFLNSFKFSRFISLPAPLSPSPSCPRRSWRPFRSPIFSRPGITCASFFRIVFSESSVCPPSWTSSRKPLRQTPQLSLRFSTR